MSKFRLDSRIVYPKGNNKQVELDTNELLKLLNGRKILMDVIDKAELTDMAYIKLESGKGDIYFFIPISYFK